MRILVTGGAGFVGSHVVDTLVRSGHDVRVLDALSPTAHQTRPDYLNPGAEYRWSDLRDVDTVRAAVEGVDAVSHQASMVGLGRDFADVDAYVAANDLGTAVLLRALHERDFRGRFVLAGSMVVYGEGRYRCTRHGKVRPPARAQEDLDAGQYEPGCPVCGRALTAEPLAEDARTDPRSVYAATKLAQEHLCAAYGRAHEVPVTVLRYHNVYGPRMPRDTPYAGVASIFKSALALRRSPSVFEDGQQRRDFIHVEDVARANVLALESGEPYDGPLNIATGIPHTVYELAAAMCAADGRGLVPSIVGGGRAGDVRHVFSATCGAQGRLGFVARVPFEAGVRALATAPLRGAHTPHVPAQSPSA